VRERKGNHRNWRNQGEQPPLRSLFVVSVMFAPQCLLACPFDAVPEGLVSEMQVSGLRAKKHCGL
jgi:hypothetical protein